MTPSAKKQLTDFLDRHGYMVGVVSAILILLSWVGKDVIGNNFQAAEKEMSAIVASREGDRFDEVMLELRNQRRTS